MTLVNNVNFETGVLVEIQVDRVTNSTTTLLG